MKKDEEDEEKGRRTEALMKELKEVTENAEDKRRKYKESVQEEEAKLEDRRMKMDKISKRRRQT